MTVTDHRLDAGQRALLRHVPTDLLIGGEWRAATGNRRAAVYDPATGAELALVADATVEDGLTALDAACAAQGDWARRAPRARAEILRRAFELVIERVEDLALLITSEMGKPLAEARVEVTYAADYLRWYAEEAVRLDGRVSTSPDGRSRVIVTHEPVGPCLLITPWNFPLAMAVRKIAPALAAGCTMIVKPALLTPLTMFLMARILSDAGVPDGVVNIVTTADPGSFSAALMADPRLRKVSFTGSTGVGQRLLEQSAAHVLRTSMELGGNAPLLVFEDADLDRAVEGALVAKLRNGGESCVAANRILVHEAVADAFTERFAARMAEVVVGRGTEPGVTVGPLISEQAVKGVAALVDDAVARGARVLVGGEVPEGTGSFYPPTVLDGVPRDARILHEEIFGPVAPIVRFADEADAIAQANDTPFGLAAYVFTENLDRATRVSGALEVGMVGLNQGLIANAAAPFGGIKYSGLGREGGSEGLGEYTNLKYVAQVIA
ncbi:NAD-dependent succinate-semialdehyde dehydrogenase [Streptosporangium sp. NBC_01469]|uniref:NAD-dependent succinate-semialdehyde dehydrogenase n=1 Tax=Streptosporangium sp. NBC_01469 TaxID=2903898 RepID=UPI002E285EB8|nr:NAD-dependent succinate-semialdehyde dehydrogenase [Streptosporangium sp. NBC_01469]